MSENEYWFITVYQHYWGRGRTPEESRKNAQKAGGKGDKWYTKRLPKNANDPFVDQFGAICWNWENEDDIPDDYVPGEPLPVWAHGKGAKVPDRRLQK